MRNTAALKTLAILLSFGFAIVAAEIVLQLADYPPSVFSPWIRATDTGYRYAPSLATRMTRPGEFDVTFKTNSDGYRDDETGPKRGRRVLLLGDSFASGYGVERDQMFASILEHDLTVEIVNASVGGYEIIHQTHYFVSRGRALEPDLAVYVLYLGNDLSRNDEWRETEDGGLVSLDREYPVRRPFELKLRWLYKQFWYNRKVRSEQERGDWTPRPDYLAMAERELSPEAAADYRRVESLLERLNAEVAACGSALFVVLMPYRTIVDRQAREKFAATVPNFDERYDLDLPGRRTGEILERLRIDYFDLTPTLERHYASGGEPLFFAVDGHLNVRGNRLVAEAIAGVLRARVDALPAGDAGTGRG